VGQVCFFSIFFSRKQSAAVSKRNLACNTHYPLGKKRQVREARAKKKKNNTVVAATADGSSFLFFFFLIIPPCHIAQHNLVQTYDALLTIVETKEKLFTVAPYYYFVLLCKLGN
jgi:hypothetical protein